MRLENFAVYGFAMSMAIGCDGASSSSNSSSGGSATGTVAVGGGSATGTVVASGGTAVASGGQSTTSSGGTSTAMSTGPLVAATIAVAAESPIPVSPLFFGQNYWSWVPSWGDAVASVETQTKDLNLKFLRAGGANNDKQSPVAFSYAEVDDFVAFARSVGAEPMLQVPLIKNIAGAAATAQDAADLVTYVNITKSYGVKYFSIGNEPDLYGSQNLMPATYDAVAFCGTFTAFAAAMRTVDPSIKIVGPDLSWKYDEWLPSFLQNCGNITDVVAVHRYPRDPTVCTDGGDYGDSVPYRSVLKHLRTLMAAAGQGTKPLAITEANVTWDGDPAKSTLNGSPGTFPAGLWVADNLGVSLEEQLHSVSYWSLSEGWTLGFFNGTAPRPAYHVLKMFSNGFGTQVLTVTGAPTGVSVYAGRDPTNAKSTLFVVNKTTSPLALTVNITGTPRTTPTTLEVMPVSLQMAALPDDGSAVVVTNYAATMTAPQVQ